MSYILRTHVNNSSIDLQHPGLRPFETVDEVRKQIDAITTALLSGQSVEVTPSTEHALPVILWGGVTHFEVLPNRTTGLGGLKDMVRNGLQGGNKDDGERHADDA